MSKSNKDLKQEMITIGMCRSCFFLEKTDHNYCPKVGTYVSPKWGCRDWALSDEKLMKIEIDKEDYKMN